MYLSDAEVAELLGVGIPELRKKLCRGDALPPSCKIPGIRKRVWLADSVHQWVCGFESDFESEEVDENSSMDSWGQYR